MATIIPYKNKDGNITAYRIQVSKINEFTGKKQRLGMTWKIPETYKSEKAIQKALDKVAGKFEAESLGEIKSADRRLSFCELAAHYIDEAILAGNKVKSVEFYNSLMPRINENFGILKAVDISPTILNNFYKKLMTEDVRKDKKATAKPELNKAKTSTHKELGALSGLNHNTVRLACQGKNISLQSAERISKALNRKTEELFDIIPLGSGKGLSAKTINHYHTFIHAVLEKGRREGIVNQNSADLSTPPKIERKEAEFFEIEEIIAIREALETQPLKYKVALFLLIDTGCRRGELVGIRWKSVDFDKNTIEICNNIQWNKEKGLFATTPKSNEIRSLSIAQEVIEVLKEYKQQQDGFQKILEDCSYNKEGYLFIQENGSVMNPSTINHWMNRFSKQYGLPHMHPHKFRHSQASILYASGIDIVTTSKRLGHKQVSTTQNIYAHLLKESDKKASDAIANALYRK